jgi:hypothetical protein
LIIADGYPIKNVGYDGAEVGENEAGVDDNMNKE